MPLSALIPILFALALCVLITPPKRSVKRRRKDGSGDDNGITINVYQQGSTIPPKVVVRDDKSDSKEG